MSTASITAATTMATACTATAPAFELCDVTLRYPGQTQPALQQVNLSVPADAICGLFGRNAAGKTSLMALLAAFRKPTSGTVRVWGEDPYENPGIVPHVAFTSNSEGNNRFGGTYKVKLHLKLGAQFRPNWDQAFAQHLVERFELPLNRTLNRLSLGQRAALRCIVGLASRAPLTIFDEAYLGMDAVFRQIFVDELLQDYLTHPRTILFSTHYIAEMERLFTEAVIIDQGRILLHDDCDNLRAQGKPLQDIYISLALKEGESI